MRRVYCSKCKHLRTPRNKLLEEHSCLHPATAKEVVTNDWFSGTTAMLGGDPKELNKNNDCQYYEAKNES